MLGDLHEYDNQNEVVDYNALPDLEKWVLHKLSETEKELDEYIEKYDINKYFSVLYMFFENDLSSFFFDIRKDCLYYDHKSKAFHMVLYTLFQHIVKSLALIMVFTAEEAVRKSNSKKNIKQYSILFFSPSLLDMKL